MKIKNQLYKPRGMNKDLSYSAFNPEYSWENKNIRLTARDGNDLLSVTNEKGNKSIDIEILGKCLGTCIIGEYLVVFTHGSSGVDRMYRISNPSDGIYDNVMLFARYLGWTLDTKIQSIPFYENESIQKVYWIDGIHQPRVINIKDETTIYTDTSFDFIQELELNEEVSVTKQYGGGSFKSGVIQYAFTYFNKSGAESNIFYITPINYISPADRGGKVDEFIQNTFKIELSNLESKYQYVRIYSIYRTSKDSTPEVKSVVDLSIGESGAVSYVDGGLTGSLLSSDILLYIGGEELIPQCISQKNNTLFLGNVELVSSSTTPSSMTEINPNEKWLFSWKESSPIELESINNGASYPYKPKSLNRSIAAHFKYDETYRLGIQGQYSNGKWSAPVWLGSDKLVDSRYQTFYNADKTAIMLTYVYGRYTPSTVAIDWFIDSRFVKVRPVMVPLNYSDRTIIAQGLVNNTLGIVKNRLQENSGSNVFAFPDYLLRTNSKAHQSTGKTYDGRYAHMDILKVNNYSNWLSSSIASPYIENMGIWNDGGDDFHDMYDYYGYSAPLNDDFDREFMFVDRNMVNFWSPDVEHNHELVSQYQDSITSAGLYGFAFNTGYNYSFSLDSGKIDDFVYGASLNHDKSNYYDGVIAYDSIIYKNIWTRVNSGGNNNNQILFPIWGPKDYVMSDASQNNISRYNIPFTKINKSGMAYFGLNRNLSGGKISYDINAPSIISNDSSIFYKTNDVDNQSNNGNVLYSKSFSKIYAGGSYANQMRDEGSGDRRTMTIDTPLNVKYNTASHALFSFKKKNSVFKCMPRISSTVSGSSSEDIYGQVPSGWYREGDIGYSADVIGRSLLKYPPEYSIFGGVNRNSLPIFDLYVNTTDKDATRYGGTSLDALYNNTWRPCGESVRVAAGMIVDYTDGDTYIGRYDTLRVFPDDLNQIPQHTEIVSFLCESFINTDGRSDVNRYNTDSSLMTKSNYGLLNNIYSQKNNYFTYNILDPLLFNTSKFNNTIIWSKTKVAGSINDAWTNLNMLSSIDLDGVYGGVSSINLFNNDLYAFQPKGIARLLFNERVQQQASDGVSVELTNGYKVPDYRYLTNQYGCSNKWSIIECKTGIYFIDYINKSLISIGEGIKDVGLSGGFKSWFNNNVYNKNYILSYDRNNNDLYIHDSETCLNYSETLQSFVSFFDYANIPTMKNVWNDFVSINYIDETDNSKVWLSNKGDYNTFYGIQKPFSIEYLLNSDPTNDKVFNTFEYRLDNQDIDWNNVEVNNWYQQGLISDNQYASNMKRKFNVNRVQFPRQSNSLNRIRSTWAKLKLSHSVTQTNINKKFDMQDLNVTYTV